MTTLFDTKLLEQRLITKDSVLGVSSSLSKCAKSLLTLKLADSLTRDEQLEQFLRDMLLIKLEIEKSLNVYENFTNHQQEYESLEHMLEESVQKTQEQINELQLELTRQQQIRKHHALCEAEAEEVNKLTSRSVLKRKISEMENLSNNAVEDLQQTEETIDRRFEQLQALSLSFTSLENKLINKSIE